MIGSYQTFIEHTGSTLTKKNALPNEYFNTYQFSSEYGKGFTAVYELDSYANICIAKHIPAILSTPFRRKIPSFFMVKFRLFNNFDFNGRCDLRIANTDAAVFRFRISEKIDTTVP